MNRIGIATLFLALGLAALACGALDTLTGGGSTTKTASELWDDVPPMDGLGPSPLDDLPLPVKLLMRIIIGNLGRLNQEGEDQTTGNIDWIAFTSSGTPDDVKDFYTNSRMSENGWDPSENSTCLSGSEQGIAEIGVFCVFAKHQASAETQLAIVAAQDDQTKQTMVFFLRLEVAATPVPNE